MQATSKEFFLKGPLNKDRDHWKRVRIPVKKTFEKEKQSPLAKPWRRIETPFKHTFKKEQLKLHVSSLPHCWFSRGKYIWLAFMLALWNHLTLMCTFPFPTYLHGSRFCAFLNLKVPNLFANMFPHYRPGGPTVFAEHLAASSARGAGALQA